MIIPRSVCDVLMVACFFGYWRPARRSVLPRQSRVLSHRTRLTDEDIGGLDVSMDDPNAVRRRKRIRDGNRIPQRLFNRQSMRFQLVAERLTADKFHRDESRVLDRIDFVDGDDVRMVRATTQIWLPG